MKNTTLKNILPLLLLSLLSLAVKAQTNVSGFISSNTTWNLAGSPYIVVGNALVSQGYTLTINPGVVIKFDSAKTLQIDGELIAIGVTDGRITFSSNKPSPAAGDWGELHFSNLSTQAVFDGSGNYLSGCIMKYCDMFYGGSLGFGLVHIESASPYISYCNIRYSKSDGIYCKGNTYIVEGSVIEHCTGKGLNYQISCGSCGLSIISDSIEFNANGGIYISGGTTGKVTGSYFLSNSVYSALESSEQNLIISGNNFINNTGGALNCSGNHTLVEKNYFLNNSTNSRMVNITGLNDTVKCNKFINNQTGSAGHGVISTYFGNEVIANNLFDSNTSSTYGVSVTDVSGSSGTYTFSFANNVIRNNSSPSGICCKFTMDLYGPYRVNNISYNDFENNTSNSIIYLAYAGNIDTVTNFLTLQFNNFSDKGSKYELYNNFLYGQEDLHIGSNFWGSSSTQHVDSVIYDYFDDGTKSVVYYGSLLTTPVIIDTSCTNFTLAVIPLIENEPINSKPFPNPFSNSTEIIFGKELKDGDVLIYNIFGQQVRAMQQVNGDRVMIERGNLSSGVYIYDVLERQGRVGNGKLVVE